MGENEVLFDPGDNVIFESPFDDLMQKIRREKFVDVRTGKICSERLV